MDTHTYTKKKKKKRKSLDPSHGYESSSVLRGRQQLHSHRIQAQEIEINEDGDMMRKQCRAIVSWVQAPSRNVAYRKQQNPACKGRLTNSREQAHKVTRGWEDGVVF